MSGPCEDLRHVTIVGTGGRVDLPLPAAAPIAELTPALARLCRAEDDGGMPPAWSLARPDAPALDLATSLAEAGVSDGDVLRLVDVSAWRTPAAPDLAGTLGAAVRIGPEWSGQATAALVAGAAVLAVAAAAALAVRTDAVEGSAGVAALLAAAAALAAAIALRPCRPASTALAAIGCVLAALGAWGVADVPPAAAGVPAAALAGSLAALAAYPVVPALSPGAALAAGALAIGSAAVAGGATADGVAGVVLVLGVTALPALPRAAGRARRLLTSLSCGTVASVLGAALVLLAGGGRQTWMVAGAMAAAAGLALICLSAIRPGWDPGLATLAARLGPSSPPRRAAAQVARRQ